jgi:signal transduction histidine kinase/ActR/RegA family two-component response regulator
MSETYFDQSEYNTIRAEIWKVAADKSLTKEKLIGDLLEIVGRFFNITRANYFEATEDAHDVECKVQWCAPEAKPYIGEKVSLSYCTELLALSNGLSVRLPASHLPPDMTRTASEYLDRHGIKSLLSMPIDLEEFSFFSFSDNRMERQWSEAEVSLVGEMIRIVSMRMDQLKTEEEKNFLEDQLRHAQTLEAIGQLAGGIAHDFNNILGAISGYAEMIRQKFSAGNPKLEKYSSAILSGAHKAADLTTQLLAFARRGRYQKVCINVHELISHVSLLLQHSLDPGIKVVLRLSAQSTCITGDPAQMQNILINLSMNARDAMPAGGTLTVTTENGDLPELLARTRPDARGGQYVIISVTDTGVGMDRRTKEKLFEPFFTTKDIGKGVGLGLASVYGSVTSHNGFITVDSQVGKGSTISLYLPTDRSVRPSGSAGDNVTRGAGLVMVVDNDEPIRAVSREMLMEMGYTVVEFESAAPALAYYRTNWQGVDLIVTDMIMEGMNGMECFREMRKINPSAKAVLSSGYSFSAEMSDIVKEGIRGVIQKPFDIIQLSHVVAEALQSPPPAS